MKKLIEALKHLAIQTGSLVCLGCGWEHNCGIHGCAIVNEAAKQLENTAHWISTEDRLPDAEEAAFFAEFGVHELEVQVAIKDAKVATVLNYADGEFYDEVTSYRVTHWAPLLKMPEALEDHHES